MAIKLNQTQARSGKRFCRNTAERRADWAENLISNIDGRPHAEPSFSPAFAGQSVEQEELHPYCLEAVMQHRASAEPDAELEPTLHNEADLDVLDCAAPTIAYAEPVEAGDSVMRTTEFLFQPDGTYIRPHYDRSGILTSIDFSDGCRFTRADAKSPWLVLDQWGKAVEGIDITSVFIDSRGNVVYIVGAEKSVIHVDGALS